MDTQDLDDTEKFAGSDIISRTDTACTCNPESAKPDGLELGVRNKGMKSQGGWED